MSHNHYMENIISFSTPWQGTISPSTNITFDDFSIKLVHYTVQWSYTCHEADTEEKELNVH